MKNKIVPVCLLITIFGLGCAKKSGGDQQAAALVNGKPISRAELDKNFTFRSQEMNPKPTGDAVNLAKMEILRDLIEREIMAQKAAELKVDVKDAEIDAQMQQLRGESSPEQFTRDLQQRGFTEQEMRNEIRRTLAVQRMVQDQVNSKVNVSDEEVSRFFNENRETFNVKETQYRIGGIVVTPNPSSPVNNLRNDKALNGDQAIKKVQTLADQLKAGSDFAQLAREYSEDPQTAPSGGDLGFQPASSLDRLGPALKQAILKMNVGDTTPIIPAQDAFWILKLLGKRDPGQRTLQDPDVAESIKNELRSRRQQLLGSAFSEQLHNDAKVENLLAKEVLDVSQKQK
jgi:peptidyl-prolyl cis-trans isomerase SurA